MPLPLAVPLIAGAVGLGGALGGLFSRERRLSPEDVRLPFLDTAQSYLDRISDPQFGFSQFERLAARSAPTLSTLLAFQAQRGGSPISAQLLSQAAQNRASDQATQAFDRFQQGLIGQQSNLISLLGRGQMFQQGLANAQNARRAQQTQSFFNQIASAGFGTLGSVLGSRQLASAFGQQGAPFGGTQTLGGLDLMLGDPRF